MTEPENLFLAPCSREQKEGTFRHFRDTVLDGINPTEYAATPDFAQDSIAVWGVVSGNQSAWEAMQPGDKVLFYTKRKVYTHVATVVATQENRELAQEIWTPYDEGRRVADITEGWPYIFYLTNVERVDIPSPQLHTDIGWETFYPQSFYRVIDERQDRLIDKYGSVTQAIRELARSDLGDAPDEVKQETETLLEEAVHDSPELTESETSHTKVRRRIRSSAFRRAVRAAYDETCAVCGANRYSPAGTPEVEAAHIYPKSERGSDDIRNGIALCKFHHWAFDTGWFSISDDHQILVRHEPRSGTHEELAEFDGRSLHLPDEDEYWPHPMFLREHRSIHGFE